MRVLNEGEAITLEDGNWIKLPTNGMYQRCCRCGLMHYWEFEPTDTGIMVCASSLSEEEASNVEARYQEQTQATKARP